MARCLANLSVNQDLHQALIKEGALAPRASLCTTDLHCLRYTALTLGDLATTYIPPADARRLQENLLASHAVGVGPALPRSVPTCARLFLRWSPLALASSA